MSTIAKAWNIKKEPTQDGIEASMKIKKNKIMMAKIRQSYREAKLGQTLFLRDLTK